jgi:leucyl/phenylalanyl-tRNA--protein transferase
MSRLAESGVFEITFDRAVRAVIAGCAEPRPGREWTWISPALNTAYLQLYAAGRLHSFEVWQGGRLVGGGFGVAIGGFWSGESMFTRVDHASKVGLLHLVRRLRERGFVLMDAQYLTPHVAQFGAYELPRAEYHRLLADALAHDVSF